jgi:hypothetical protein
MKDLLKSISFRLKHLIVSAIPYFVFLHYSDYVHSAIGTQYFMVYGWLALKISFDIADKITGAES